MSQDDIFSHVFFLRVKPIQTPDAVSLKRSSPAVRSLPPAVVCVCPVGFGHLVKVMFALHHIPLISEGGQQLLREFLVHVCATVLVVSAFCDQPLHGQKTPAIIRQRDGNLQEQ